MTTHTFPPHVEEWLQFLETTDLLQAQEYLVGYPTDENGDSDYDAPIGYCCLGVVCTLMPDGERYLDPCNLQLMPAEAVRWLGLEDSYGGNYGSLEDAEKGLDNFDIHLDWPTEQYPWHNVQSIVVTASALNDGGCTFKQIAQVIRYFGIKKVA